MATTVRVKSYTTKSGKVIPAHTRIVRKTSSPKSRKPKKTIKLSRNQANRMDYLLGEIVRDMKTISRIEKQEARKNKLKGFTGTRRRFAERVGRNSAKEIFNFMNNNPDVRPVLTKEFSTKKHKSRNMKAATLREARGKGRKKARQVQTIIGKGSKHPTFSGTRRMYRVGVKNFKRKAVRTGGKLGALLAVAYGVNEYLNRQKSE